MSKNISNSPPNWQKDAIPSIRGWHHPRTNELLVSTRLTQEFVDSYLRKCQTAEPEVEQITVQSEPEVKEAPKKPRAKKKNDQ